jgi:hypothetical protein
MRPRPLSITIFGILNIGFALFGFVSLLLSTVMLHSKLQYNSILNTMQSDPSNGAWANFSTGVSGALALVLLVAGIGLLLTQSWARVLSIVYSVTCMIYVVASSVVNYPSVQAMLARIPSLPPGSVPAMALAATFFSLIFGLAYPVLLLFFMTRPKVIAAFAPGPPPAPIRPGPMT